MSNTLEKSYREKQGEGHRASVECGKVLYLTEQAWKSPVRCCLNKDLKKQGAVSGLIKWMGHLDFSFPWPWVTSASSGYRQREKPVHCNNLHMRWRWIGPGWPYWRRHMTEMVTHQICNILKTVAVVYKFWGQMWGQGTKKQINTQRYIVKAERFIRERSQRNTDYLSL